METTFYSILLPLIGIVLMLCAGFIGGFFAYAVENKLEAHHPYTTEKKIKYLGKMLQYIMIALAIYIIINTVDIALAVLAYLYAEYFFPKVLQGKYQNIFSQGNQE